MPTATLKEINKFRLAFVDDQEVLDAIAVIEECQGNLEDAAEVLAVEAGITSVDKAGKDPEQILGKLIEKARKILCRKECREQFVNGSFEFLMGYLMAVGDIPKAMTIPVLMCAAQMGLEEFCPKKPQP